MNKYNVGDTINNILFKQEATKRGNIRYGIFICPICLSEFEWEVMSIVRRTKLNCGCNKRTGSPYSRHGHAKLKTPEYRSWTAMKDRCLCITNRAYPRYGGAGVKICDRWKYSFDNFLSDMGPRPSLGHTLDRYPNQKGNYEPGNCRWANWNQQARNRKNTILVNYKGETTPLIDICEKIGLDYAKLRKKNNGKHKSHQEAIDYVMRMQSCI